MSAVRWAAVTDVGQARERNEDNYYAGERIFAVADGLGGHRAGEVASKIAVDELAKLDRSKARDIAAALEASVREANQAVHERQAANPETRGMGTTITALAVQDGMAHLAHVGDSRCYLLRQGQISLVSHDHTLVARMVDEGTLTEEQAEAHPQRSILTRAIGAESTVQVDTLELGLAAGDRILLCSDGLSSVVPMAEIHRALQAGSDPQAVADSLVAEANRLGGPDNITVVVLEVPPEGTAEGADPGKGGFFRRFRRDRRRRRMPVRVIVWTLSVAMGLVAVLAALRIWVDRSWYVGTSGKEVTIFRGLPTDIVGIALHHKVEKTELSVDQVAPYYRPRLNEGIRAPSLEAARRIVREQIPRATQAATNLQTGQVSPAPSSSHT